MNRKKPVKISDAIKTTLVEKRKKFCVTILEMVDIRLLNTTKIPCVNY